MYRRWRNWVWACWAVLKRWWRNSGAGGRLQRLTSSCCETSPSKSGSVLRTWSTSTIRKSTHCRLLCHQCLLLSCCPFFFFFFFSTSLIIHATVNCCLLSALFVSVHLRAPSADTVGWLCWRWACEAAVFPRVTAVEGVLQGSLL